LGKDRRGRRRRRETERDRERERNQGKEKGGREEGKEEREREREMLGRKDKEGHGWCAATLPLGSAQSWHMGDTQYSLNK
jgi:hypothetical protein